MNIGGILKTVGSGLLKEVPAGGLIMDAIELVTGETVDRNTITGAQMQAIINKLPPEQQANFLNKQLDTKARLVESHDKLVAKMQEDSPSSRARAAIAKVVAGFMMLLTLMFSWMLMDQYLKTGNYPSVESLAIVYGFPCIALLAFFGVDTKALQELIITILTRQIARRK